MNIDECSRIHVVLAVLEYKVLEVELAAIVVVERTKVLVEIFAQAQTIAIDGHELTVRALFLREWSSLEHLALDTLLKCVALKGSPEEALAVLACVNAFFVLITFALPTQTLPVASAGYSRGRFDASILWTFAHLASPSRAAIADTAFAGPATPTRCTKGCVAFCVVTLAELAIVLRSEVVSRAVACAVYTSAFSRTKRVIVFSVARDNILERWRQLFALFACESEN